MDDQFSRLDLAAIMTALDAQPAGLIGGAFQYYRRGESVEVRVSDPGDGNLVYELADLLTAIGGGGARAWVSDIPQFEGLPERRRKLQILSRVADVIDLLAHIDTVGDGRVGHLVEAVSELQGRLIDAFSKQTGADFIAAIGGKHVIDNLRTIGDVVAMANIDTMQPIDRGELEKQTAALIGLVKTSDLDDYPKRALLMKLTAIRRVLVECSHYTDDDLRRRVKSVMADYWAEARKHEWDNNALNEKMARWAATACRTGIFALALTADVSSVVALLPKP